MGGWEVTHHGDGDFFDFERFEEVLEAGLGVFDCRGITGHADVVGKSGLVEDCDQHASGWLAGVGFGEHVVEVALAFTDGRGFGEVIESGLVERGEVEAFAEDIDDVEFAGDFAGEGDDRDRGLSDIVRDGEVSGAHFGGAEFLPAFGGCPVHLGGGHAAVGAGLHSGVRIGSGCGGSGGWRAGFGDGVGLGALLVTGREQEERGEEEEGRIP
ncbi:MAG: hypothetical protein RI897_3262 [Verrucomicrobiota bacterium]